MVISTVIRFEGMFSLTYNKIPPPFELQTSLHGVHKPSIKDLPSGKLSSIFISEIDNVAFNLF